jgi:GNAT superfamily N-acetyltransferase
MMKCSGRPARLLVTGYRFLCDFVRGKYIYVEDFFSTDKARFQGLGAELLKSAENVAAETGCEILGLCTGIENERGVKFMIVMVGLGEHLLIRRDWQSNGEINKIQS